MSRFRIALCFLLALLAAAGPLRSADETTMTAGAETARPPRQFHSLIFTDAQVAAIQKAIDISVRGSAAGMTGPAAAESELTPEEAPGIPNIYVSAILDLGGGDWTVWANGYRITPIHQPRIFKVVSVNDNVAEIAVEGDHPTHFLIRPYQTWRAHQQDIVEGIFK